MPASSRPRPLAARHGVRSAGRGRGRADRQGAAAAARDLPRLGALPLRRRGASISRRRRCEPALARAIDRARAGDRVVAVPLGGAGTSARRARAREPSQATRSLDRRGFDQRAMEDQDVVFHHQPSGPGRASDPRPRVALAAVRYERVRACASRATRSRKDADGDYVERPNFFDVTVFGASAESVERYMRKGSRVAVDGQPRVARVGDRRAAVARR